MNIEAIKKQADDYWWLKEGYINVLHETKKQLREIVGMLALVEFNIPNDDKSDGSYWIKQANARLVGLVQGLENIVDHAPIEEEIHR